MMLLMMLMVTMIIASSRTRRAAPFSGCNFWGGDARPYQAPRDGEVNKPLCGEYLRLRFVLCRFALFYWSEYVEQYGVCRAQYRPLQRSEHAAESEKNIKH